MFNPSHDHSNKNIWLLVLPYSITLGINVAWSSVLDINVEAFGITQVSPPHLCYLFIYFFEVIYCSYVCLLSVYHVFSYQSMCSCSSSCLSLAIVLAPHPGFLQEVGQSIIQN